VGAIFSLLIVSLLTLSPVEIDTLIYMEDKEVYEKYEKNKAMVYLLLIFTLVLFWPVWMFFIITELISLRK
jgi:hypothetical protein